LFGVTGQGTAMETNKKRLINWAMDEKGDWCHVDTADKSSQYRCIACNRPLILRQGDVRIYHFAHAVECDCSKESVIHSMAKSIVAQAREVALPKASGDGAVEYDGYRKRFNYEVPELASPFSIVSGSTEEKVSVRWICDALIMGESNVRVAFEVRYTNPKSGVDIERFQQHQMPVVEIDVRGAESDWSLGELTHWVLFEAPRQWLICPPLVESETQARRKALTALIERSYANPRSEKRRKSRMQAQRAVLPRTELPRFELAIMHYVNGEPANIRIEPITGHATDAQFERPVFHPELVTVKKKDIDGKYGWSGLIEIESSKGGVKTYPFYYVEKRKGFESIELPEEPYAVVFDDESKRQKQYLIRFQNIEHWVDKLSNLKTR